MGLIAGWTQKKEGSMNSPKLIKSKLNQFRDGKKEDQWIWHFLVKLAKTEEKIL